MQHDDPVPGRRITTTVVSESVPIASADKHRSPVRFRWLVSLAVAATIIAFGFGVRCQDDDYRCGQQTGASVGLTAGLTLLAFALAIWQFSPMDVRTIAAGGRRRTTRLLAATAPGGLALVTGSAGWLVAMVDRPIASAVGTVLVIAGVVWAALAVAVSLSGRPAALTLPALRNDRAL